MYKKLIFTISLITTLLAAGVYAQSQTTPAAKPAAKTETKAAAPAAKAADKAPVKSVLSEDEKYAQVYEKCTKEAGKIEAKYDQLFNACMDKNGFPQEEYETGGQVMHTPEGQDN